jgi:hypothetical protein
MTPRISSATIQNSHPAQSDSDHTNLSRRYGSIGIQAVAAAARYADGRKSPVHAQAPGLRIDLRFVESAN